MVLKTEPIVVNMGPQHPSTHGVFRMKLTVDGEVVVDLEPVFGYLHRGTEKLAEGKTYTQNVPMTDRLDYLAAMSNNLAYVQSVEKLCGIPVPERAEYLRVIAAELSRISSHLMATGQLIDDCGAWHTPMLHMFREREKILDLFELMCGQRLTHNYMRIGGLSRDVPEDFYVLLKRFVDEMDSRIDGYERLIATNEIVLARLVGLAPMTQEQAINASQSGPVLRATGLQWDIRRKDPYSIYERLQFEVPVGKNGDSYDRFWVRGQEMRQSVRILRQCLEQLPGGPVKAETLRTVRPPLGDVYTRIESPKGELGFYLVSDGGIAPYRFKVRPPTLINLTLLRDICLGLKVADIVVVFGSLDVVLGEVDR